MENIKKIQKNSKLLRNKLHLKTYPFGVRFLENEDDIPDGAIRPQKDLGSSIMLCQAFALTRREGATVGLGKDDHYCYAPYIALGYAKTLDAMLKGDMGYPMSYRTKEAAAKAARRTPALEKNKYSGLVAAPLHTIEFDPHLLLVYCDASQLEAMVMMTRYATGNEINSTLETGAACVYSTVAPFINGESKLTIPCGGDKGLAMAGNDELIFTVPGDKIDDFMAGVAHFCADDTHTPFSYTMNYRPALPDKFLDISQKIGMKI